MVNAVRTKPDVTVRKGEELSVNYGYSVNVALPWFNRQFAQFRKEQPQMAKKIMDRFGMKDDSDPEKNPEKDPESDPEEGEPPTMMTNLAGEAESTTEFGIKS